MSINEVTRPYECVEITPCSHPRLVALRIGRYVNELRHQIELAWLGVGDAGNRVRQLWHQLRLFSRGLTDEEMQREIWAAELTDAQEFWESVFLKEWHIDAYWAMQNDLASIQRVAVTHSGAQTVAEVLDEAMSGISGFLDRLGSLLTAELGDEYLETMSFGQRLDQLIHARHPHRHLEVQCGPQDIGDTGWDTERLESVHVATNDIQLVLVNQCVVTEMFDELQLRWEQLGYSRSSFLCLDVDSTANTVRRIESQFQLEIEDDPANPTESLGHLGLGIEGLRVSRKGYHAVEMQSRLGLAVLRRLISSGSRPVSRQELSDYWEEMGGTDPTPEDSTIRARIRLLRETIQPLGVTIRNVRGLGWRLVPQD